MQALTNDERFRDYPEILTVEQLSEMFSIGKSKAYELTKLKGFPKLPIPKPIRIPKRELLVWLEKESFKSNN